MAELFSFGDKGRKFEVGDRVAILHDAEITGIVDGKYTIKLLPSDTVFASTQLKPIDREMESLISDTCKSLGIEGQYFKGIHLILDSILSSIRIKKNRSIRGYAAAVIDLGYPFQAPDDPFIFQKKIANTLDISVATLQKRKKELKEKIDNYSLAFLLAGLDKWSKGLRREDD